MKKKPKPKQAGKSKLLRKTFGVKKRGGEGNKCFQEKCFTANSSFARDAYGSFSLNSILCLLSGLKCKKKNVNH